jgi:glycosyltransferase involved in cell wall biosynthesis
MVKILGQALVKNGVRVSVVGTNYPGRGYEFFEDGGIRVYLPPYRPYRPFTWWANFRGINQELSKLHRQNPISIVEASEMGLAFIQKFRRIKYIIRLHGGHHFFAQSEHRKVNWWKGWQEKRSFAQADGAVAVSEFVYDHTAQYLDLGRFTRRVVANPVDPSRFYQANPAKAVRGRILFVGTVCEKKGVRQLLLALPKIKAEVPEAHLHIVGPSQVLPDGQLYADYLKRFVDPAVADAVRFWGRQPNQSVPGLIEQSQVCVYPSHMEALPMAWLEVLCMGKPLIGSRIGPGPEVITDEQTGLLCDPHDPDDIARKTIRLLQNPTLGFALGAGGRAEALARFDVKNLVHENLRHYQEILG